MTTRLRRVTVGGAPRVVDLARPPVMTITTTGGAPILDRETYINATFSIGDVHAGSTQIRGRGNSTWDLPKKPYRLKLTTAAALLGMPAERDWVLLANAYDPTMMRNAIAMEMGRRCPGLAWSPRFRHVELVLNGAYLGVYQLGEHVEISRPSKVNVTAASGTTGLASTGAYTLEIDQRLEENAEVGWRTPLQNVPVTFDDPDGTNATQFAYVQGFVNAFEAALYSSSWLDPTAGYARYLDRDSWIDWYLVNELCANNDSNFYSSCKLYKTRDTADAVGRLVMGPLWDFDLSLGLQYGVNTQRNPNALHTRASWLTRLFNDPAFAAAAAARWAALRTSLTSSSGSIYTWADREYARVAYALPRDRARWGWQADWRADLGALKTWLATRIAYLDGVFGTTQPAAGYGTSTYGTSPYGG